MFTDIHLQGPKPRDNPPELVALNSAVLLPLINEAVKSCLIAKEPTRVCWTQILQEIKPKVKDSLLFEYLEDSTARHLTTIFLAQIPWDESWTLLLSLSCNVKKH